MSRTKITLFDLEFLHLELPSGDHLHIQPLTTGADHEGVFCGEEFTTLVAFDHNGDLFYEQ